MEWSPVMTTLIVVFALILVCGLLIRVLCRRFCRPRAWTGDHPSSPGFGCCGRSDRFDERGFESPRPPEPEPSTGNDGR
jgi:hypothetical protein